MTWASSEDSDQPGHPPSLIRVFAVRMKKAWVLSCPLSGQRRLIRLGTGWMPSLIWVFTGRTGRFVGFVMLLLSFYHRNGWTLMNTVTLVMIQEVFRQTKWWSRKMMNSCHIRTMEEWTWRALCNEECFRSRRSSLIRIHCLPFNLHLFEGLLYRKTKLSKF